MACIKALLEQGADALQGSSCSPELDASILLAFVLERESVYLRTWPEREVGYSVLLQFQQLISLRSSGQPIAYLVGYKEFWDYRFSVDEHTLIPRPETELLVELALQQLPHHQPLNIADLGTGSGAIAITLGKQCPEWNVYATDLSAKALEKAQCNAQRLETSNVRFVQGSWFNALDKAALGNQVLGNQVSEWPAVDQFDAIISNPPYIAADDPHLSPQVADSEPEQALISAQQGYADLHQIIAGAPVYLKSGAWLMLEHGFEQGSGVRDLMAQHGFGEINTYQDLGGLDRCTMGRRPDEKSHP